LTLSIVISAVVVTLYTMVGGMWAVAYTDALQLGLVVVGLAVALPFAMTAPADSCTVLGTYVITAADAAVFLPPLQAHGPLWTSPAIVGWCGTSR
jgi:high affinity choline transporter 7